MAFCPFCERPLSCEDAAFCGACGAALNSGAPTGQQLVPAGSEQIAVTAGAQLANPAQPEQQLAPVSSGENQLAPAVSKEQQLAKPEPKKATEKKLSLWLLIIPLAVILIGAALYLFAGPGRSILTQSGSSGRAPSEFLYPGMKLTDVDGKRTYSVTNGYLDEVYEYKWQYSINLCDHDSGPGTEVFSTIDRIRWIEAVDGYIYCIAYSFTGEDYIVRVDPETSTSIQMTRDSDGGELYCRHICGLYPDDDGNVWTVVANGHGTQVYVIRSGSDSPELVTELGTDIDNAFFISDGLVYACAPVGGTENVLCSIDITTGERTAVYHAEVQSAAMCGGQVFFVDKQGVLGCLDPESGEYIRIAERVFSDEDMIGFVVYGSDVYYSAQTASEYVDYYEEYTIPDVYRYSLDSGNSEAVIPKAHIIGGSMGWMEYVSNEKLIYLHSLQTGATFDLGSYSD